MGASAFQRPGRQSTRLARPVLPNARGAQREGAGGDGAPPRTSTTTTTKDCANNKNKKICPTTSRRAPACPTTSSSPPATSAARNLLRNPNEPAVAATAYGLQNKGGGDEMNMRRLRRPLLTDTSPEETSTARVLDSYSTHA